MKITYTVTSYTQVHPDWRLMDQFVVFEHQAIFGADSVETAPALSSPCNTPAECQARFTSISYDKGTNTNVSSIISDFQIWHL